jgi:hypothetical protein
LDHRATGVQRASSHRSQPLLGALAGVGRLLPRLPARTLGAALLGLAAVFPVALPAAAAESHMHADALGEGRIVRDVRPGDVVRDHGITVQVPPRGRIVWGALEFEHGRAQVLGVETTRSGRVRAFGLGDELAVTGSGLAGALAGRDGGASSADAATSPDGSAGQCSDGSYSAYSWRMPLYAWRYNSGSTPYKFRARTGGTRAVIDAIIRGNRNITAADNDCGRGDYISARMRYDGTTDRRTNIGSSGSCLTRDGRNVIGWGDLPSHAIAMACVFGLSDGRASEADVKLSWDKAYETSMGRCSGELLIEAAMTHEFGHVYGLGHVSYSGSRYLTMQPYVNQCSMAHASLGLGDMRGLERKY